MLHLCPAVVKLRVSQGLGMRHEVVNPPVVLRRATASAIWDGLQSSRVFDPLRALDLSLLFCSAEQSIDITKLTWIIQRRWLLNVLVRSDSRCFMATTTQEPLLPFAEVPQTSARNWLSCALFAMGQAQTSAWSHESPHSTIPISWWGNQVWLSRFCREWE